MNTRLDTTRGLSRWRQRLSTMRRARVWMAAADGFSAAALTQAFDDWAAAHEGAAVEVCLPSRALLMWADPDVSEAPALRERAIERWAHYLDLPAADFDHDWLLQTSLDLGVAPVALACAVPRALLEGLQDVAQRRGLVLRAVSPWWARPLLQAQRSLPAVGDATGDATGDAAVLRGWVGREGAWLTQAVWAVDARTWVLRSLSCVTAGEGEGVRADDSVDAPEATRPDSAVRQAPARSQVDWDEALNFAGPRVPVSFWSWALLALSAIALVHALVLHQQMAESEQLTQDEGVRLRAHARPPRADGAASGVVPVEAAQGGLAGAELSDGPEPLRPEAWRAAAQLAAHLAHPWAEALDQVDASAHRRGVALTRFQLDLATWGTQPGQALPWRLQAAVPDDATALDWVQDLGPRAMLQRRDALPQAVQSDRHLLAWRIDVGIDGDPSGGQP